MRERIPADVGDFLAWCEAIADFGEGREAGDVRGFGAACEKPLQADADTEEGNTGGDAILDRGLQPAFVEEFRRGEMTDAGKDDAVGAKDDELDRR